VASNEPGMETSANCKGQRGILCYWWLQAFREPLWLRTNTQKWVFCILSTIIQRKKESKLDVSWQRYTGPWSPAHFGYNPLLWTMLNLFSSCALVILCWRLNTTLKKLWPCLVQQLLIKKARRVASFPLWENFFGS